MVKQPDPSSLRRVANDYREALVAVENARAAHAEARAEVNRLQRERRAQLLAVVGDGTDPDRMRAAAIALGVTTPRVYQLVRTYEAKVNVDG